MPLKNTVRTFILPSEGMGPRQCSDRFAVSLPKGRYCVADGVSNSYCGSIMAGLMCLDFLSEKAPASSWREGLETEPGRKEVLSALFEEDCAFLLGSLPPSEREWLQRMKKRFRHGATTLAGISVEGPRIHYSVSGDSCLWVRKTSGETLCIPMVESFSDRTEALTSDWTTEVGTLSGTLPLEKGYIVLATDALSAWIKGMNDLGEDPFGILASIPDQESFARFAKRQRDGLGKVTLHDDDVCAVILTVEDPEGEFVLEGEPFTGRLDALLEE